MSERNEYPAGVPCWVDTLQADADVAMRFYRGVFGWEFEESSAEPQDRAERYVVARLRGRDVAGIGSREPDRGTSDWNTYIAVESVDDAVDRATSAGGSLLDSPLDASPAGRLALLADPTGARFGVWQPELRQGAQLVNEPSAWSMSLLNTTDPARARSFYDDVFGWEYEAFDMGGGEMTLCRLPGYLGGEPSQPVPRDVVAVAVPTSEKSSWSVDFWIANADEAASTARGLGGAVIQEPQDASGFRTAVLADPSGATFSVSTLIVDGAKA